MAVRQRCKGARLIYYALIIMLTVYNGGADVTTIEYRDREPCEEAVRRVNATQPANGTVRALCVPTR